MNRLLFGILLVGIVLASGCVENKDDINAIIDNNSSDSGSSREGLTVECNVPINTTERLVLTEFEQHVFQGKLINWTVFAYNSLFDSYDFYSGPVFNESLIEYYVFPKLSPEDYFSLTNNNEGWKVVLKVNYEEKECRRILHIYI